MAYDYTYNIALSYASEDTVFVRRIYSILSKYLPSIFFAPARQEELIGEDMYGEFFDVYRYKALYVAAFVSEHYVNKAIPMHEASSALLRRNDEKRNCFLPVYLDGTSLPKLPSDVLYVSAKDKSEAEIANILKGRVERDPLYNPGRMAADKVVEAGGGSSGVHISKNENIGIQTIIGRVGTMNITNTKGDE